MRHSDPMDTFIKNLNFIRTRNEWDVTTLAEQCEMSQPEMSRLLNRKRKGVHVDTLNDIAEHLGFKLHELLDPNFEKLVASH